MTENSTTALRKISATLAPLPGFTQESKTDAIFDRKKKKQRSFLAPEISLATENVRTLICTSTYDQYCYIASSRLLQYHRVSPKSAGVSGVHDLYLLFTSTVIRRDPYLFNSTYVRRSPQYPLPFMFFPGHAPTLYKSFHFAETQFRYFHQTPVGCFWICER